MLPCRDAWPSNNTRSFLLAVCCCTLSVHAASVKSCIYTDDDGSIHGPAFLHCHHLSHLSLQVSRLRLSLPIRHPHPVLQRLPPSPPADRSPQTTLLHAIETPPSSIVGLPFCARLPRPTEQKKPRFPTAVLKPKLRIP
jgi:hypothetical protein